MTIPEILKKLEVTTDEGFPAEAVKAAIEQREAVTPHLLQALEEVAATPLKFARRAEYMLHIYAMFLLAQFREKRAYPLIVTICRAPCEMPDALLGDVVTEGLCRILASVYDGDPAPLQTLVESENVYEFVRDAAINTFDHLVLSGQMSRDSVVDYFRALFHGRLAREHSQVWNGLVCAVASLPAPELLDEVRQACADNLVDRTVAEFEDIELDARSPKRESETPPIITDTADEMSWWATFRTDDEDSAPGQTRQDGLSPSGTMSVSAILNQFTACPGGFPALAMEAAVAQQETITPHLLRALEAVAANPLSFADRPDCVLHLFAIMLLAQFREKRAYSLIVAIFSAPDDIPQQLGGDIAQDSLGRILASVYDGNSAPLQALIENEKISESVRAEAVGAFVSLVRSNQIPSEEVINYFRALMRGKLRREESSVWLALVRAAGDLPAPELMDDARQAFADGLIDAKCLTLDELEEELAPDDPWRDEQFGLITDAAYEMEFWPEFERGEEVFAGDDSQDDDDPDGGPVYDLDAPLPTPGNPAPGLPAYEYTPRQPFISEPKIGRNDPCPCGSGKKYKKCCGKN